MKAYLPIIVTAAMVSHIQAATVINNSSTPVVNGEDIAQLTGTSVGTFNVGKWWTDTNDPGQIFTTGTSNSYFNSLSLYVQNSLTSGDHGITIRISTISGSTLTPLYSETGTWNKTGVTSGDYVTFALDTPYLLNASSQYAVDLQVTSASGSIPNIGYATGNPYDGGSRYYVNAGATAVTLRGTEDYNFHIDMTAVPEPSAALLGLLGAGFLVSRRRR